MILIFAYEIFSYLNQINLWLLKKSFSFKNIFVFNQNNICI